MISLARVVVAAALLAISTIAPAKAETSFLEAAMYFITAVEPVAGDTVTDDEIILTRYPIVAYLVSDNRCAIRIRRRNEPYWVLQMDFCKINARNGGLWYGYKTALCVMGHDSNDKDFMEWNKNENYFGPIDEQNSKCGYLQTGDANPSNVPLEPIWGWLDDINTLLDSDFLNPGQTVARHDRQIRRTTARSQQRMIASYKYIQSLLTGKPY
jgi:hypothetical protein